MDEGSEEIQDVSEEIQDVSGASVAHTTTFAVVAGLFGISVL